MNGMCWISRCLRRKVNEKNQGALMCQSKLKMNKQMLLYLISKIASFEKQDNQVQRTVRNMPGFQLLAEKHSGW